MTFCLYIYFFVEVSHQPDCLLSYMLSPVCVSIGSSILLLSRLWGLCCLASLCVLCCGWRGGIFSDIQKACCHVLWKIFYTCLCHSLPIFMLSIRLHPFKVSWFKDLYSPCTALCLHRVFKYLSEKLHNYPLVKMTACSLYYSKHEISGGVLL